MRAPVVCVCVCCCPALPGCNNASSSFFFHFPKAKERHMATARAERPWADVNLHLSYRRLRLPPPPTAPGRRKFNEDEEWKVIPLLLCNAETRGKDTHTHTHMVCVYIYRIEFNWASTWVTGPETLSRLVQPVVPQTLFSPCFPAASAQRLSSFFFFFFSLPLFSVSLFTGFLPIKRFQDFEQDYK